MSPLGRMILLKVLGVLAAAALAAALAAAAATGTARAPAAAPAAPVRSDAITELQRAADCWAYHGGWVFEPASFYGHPRGNRSTRECTLLRSPERVNEIGYRWMPSPGRCPRYLRDAALVAALRQQVPRLKVLLLGDSTQRILHTTLHDLLDAYKSPLNLNVTFVFNAHVALNTETALINNNNTLLSTWLHLLQTEQWPVIVLNRGQHQVPPDVYLPDYRKTLAYVRHQNPQALLIVRTTPAGHLGCETMRNHAPLTVAPTIPSTHFWSKIATANAHATNLVRNEFAGQAVLMDVVPATALRADSHIVTITRRNRTDTASTRPHFAYDCVHYCVPGPADMWAEFLGNLILLGVELGLVPIGKSRP